MNKECNRKIQKQCKIPSIEIIIYKYNYLIYYLLCLIKRLPPLSAAGNTGVYFPLSRNFKPIRMRDLTLFQYFSPTRVIIT